MNKLSIIPLAVAAGLLVPAVASAEVIHDAIEEKKLDSGKQRMSTDQGYIFLHSPFRSAFMLIKQPTPAEITAFEEERQAELAEAREKYSKKLQRWQRDVDFAKQTRRSDDIPPRPVEPTDANFSIGVIESRFVVSVGPGDPFSKAEDYFSYLHQLEPGTYRYYGPIMWAPNGSVAGTCSCMGSVQFTVEAGKITNLGDFLTFGWATKEQGLASNVEWQREEVPKPTDYGLPPRLADFPNQQADWRAAGKVDNFYGVMIGRIPPVPGVLAYERDRIVDLKASASAARAP